MPHVADTALLTGPFFLGFTLEAFGMGIVLVMSLNFFIAVKRRERRQRVQEEAMGGSSDGNGDGKRGSGRGAVVLVAVCMGLNMAQTMVDMYRGWNVHNGPVSLALDVDGGGFSSLGGALRRVVVGAAETEYARRCHASHRHEADSRDVQRWASSGRFDVGVVTVVQLLRWECHVLLSNYSGSLSPTLAHTLHTSGPIAGNAMSLHRRKRRRDDEAGNQKNSFETSKVFFERSRSVLSTLRLDFERVSKDREHTWPNYFSSSADKDLKQERRASEPASVVPLISARASASSSTAISPQRDAHGKLSKYYLPKDHPLNHPLFVLSPPKRPEKVVGVERKHVFSGDWVKRRKRSGGVTSQIENESKEKSSLMENPRIHWEGESSPYALLSPSASSCSNPLSPSRRTTQTTGEWDSYRSGSGDLLFSKSPAASPGPDHLSTLFTNETVPSEGKTLSFAQMLNEKEDNLLERTTTLSSTYKPSNASRASFEIMFSGSKSSYNNCIITFHVLELYARTSLQPFLFCGGVHVSLCI
ncbi:uncharacterized protein L203_101191 [Cryptococcus depauperatus CBS 7841]|uniref:Uncharacterized protein n=1 Tax=Cryptococcus depauperatus CBS 7841 TaxID=1295531 RepID=A0AAJ8JPF7_9TREE